MDILSWYNVVVFLIQFIYQIKGVKGASVLCIHQPFNLVKGTVIDGLHSIFIGVVKQVLKLWTDKANRGKDYYI